MINQTYDTMSVLFYTRILIFVSPKNNDYSNNVINVALRLSFVILNYESNIICKIWRLYPDLTYVIEDKLCE